MLDTSRLITGNLQLELSPTDVGPLIEAAIEMVKPSADSKNVTVGSEIEEGVDSLTCDAQRLQQMIWNLLTNAVKFTPANGKVGITCRRHEKTVEISVSDSGIGIAPDFLPYVFDRFRQEDSSSTRSNGGLGLGLSIVRHLSELHGGTVAVESDGPGKGATFSISLPITSSVRSERPMLGKRRWKLRTAILQNSRGFGFWWLMMTKIRAVC